MHFSHHGQVGGDGCASRVSYQWSAMEDVVLCELRGLGGLMRDTVLVVPLVRRKRSFDIPFIFCGSGVGLQRGCGTV